MTYKKFPEGAKAMFMADRPMGAVAPPVCGTVVSAPFVPIENTEMSFDSELAAYRKLPDGSITRSVGDVPVGCLGVTSVSPPVLEIVYSEMLLLPELAAYRSFPEGSIANDSTADPAEIDDSRRHDRRQYAELFGRALA